MVWKHSLPVHERLSSPGTRLYDFQDRVRVRVPEDVGKEGIVPIRIPCDGYAHQGAVVCHPIISRYLQLDRLQQIKSFARLSYSVKTSPGSARRRKPQTHTPIPHLQPQRTIPIVQPPRVHLLLLPRPPRSSPRVHVSTRQRKASRLRKPPVCNTNSRSWSLSASLARRSRNLRTHTTGWSTSHPSVLCVLRLLRLYALC